MKKLIVEYKIYKDYSKVVIVFRFFTKFQFVIHYSSKRFGAKRPHIFIKRVFRNKLFLSGFKRFNATDDLFNPVLIRGGSTELPIKHVTEYYETCRYYHYFEDRYFERLLRAMSEN